MLYNLLYNSYSNFLSCPLKMLPPHLGFSQKACIALTGLQSLSLEQFPSPPPIFVFQESRATVLQNTPQIGVGYNFFPPCCLDST